VYLLRLCALLAAVNSADTDDTDDTAAAAVASGWTSSCVRTRSGAWCWGGEAQAGHASHWSRRWRHRWALVHLGGCCGTCRVWLSYIDIYRLTRQSSWQKLRKHVHPPPHVLALSPQRLTSQGQRPSGVGPMGCI
jgi:hypothetical protein